jgi:NAD(P)H dehydrogenase (quinone)
MRRVLGLLVLLGLGPLAAAQERIIVSGASGQLGGLVVEELLTREVDPKRLILVSRTPDALQQYAARGASVRFGDFTKPESLAAAYAGGTRMLLISINAGGGRRPELHKAAIDAAIAAGVEHIAYTSYINADRNVASEIAVDHRRTERYLEESGVAWTMLRNHIYANGLVDQAAQILREGRLVTHTPDARVAYVTREDCAAAAAAVLSTAGHENRAYNITGPDAIGPRELVALVTELSGRPAELVTLDEAAYRRHLLDSGMPEAAVRGSLSFAAELDSPYLREPSTAVADLTGRPATSVRELLSRNLSRWAGTASGSP